MSRRTGHVWTDRYSGTGTCRKCGQSWNGEPWTIWCVMKATMRQLFGKRRGGPR